MGLEDLAGAVASAGYSVVLEQKQAEDAHAREDERLRSRFVAAAVLTFFVLVGSLPHMLGLMLMISTWWLNLGLLLLTTLVQFFGWVAVLPGRLEFLRHRVPT